MRFNCHRRCRGPVCVGYWNGIGLWLAIFWVLGLQAGDPVRMPLPSSLVVGSELDYPPFALVKGNQEADGFTVELWKAVAHEAGLTSTIRVGPFHSILEGFKAGEIDVMINLAQSPERAGFCSFAVPHVTAYGAIFVRKGETGIRSDADLPGRKLIVLNRDLAHDYAISRGWTNHLVLVDDVVSGLKLLSAGRHDAMLVAKLAGLNTLRENRIENVRALGERLDFNQKFAFAVLKARPGSSELLARINEGLALVKANGTYDILYEKWFGILEPRDITWRQILRYLVPIGLLTLLVSGAYMVERRLRLRLKRTVSLLNATLESTVDGILAVDERGSVTACNRKLATSGLLPPHTTTVTELLAEAVFRSLLDQLKDPGGFEVTLSALASGSEAETFDTLYLKDGRCLEVVSNVQRVEGRLRGRVWSFRDVTKREQAAEQIRRFNAELEQRVAERTRELAQAAEKLRQQSGKLTEVNAHLEQALRSRDGFLAAMSHELRTPLHGILGLTELLLDPSFGGLNPRQAEFVQRARECGEHLLELINDILDLARIQASGITLDQQDGSVEELCRSAVRLVEDSAQKKQHVLEVSVGSPGLRVRADRRRLKQVLVNLLSNAVKFTPAGGCIGLAVSASGHEIRFAVSDNGIGIAEDKIGRLFQAFVQLDNRLSREHSGTGLGLALVRELVDAHGGRVELDTAVGRGSRFTVVLPWEPELAEALPLVDSGDVAVPVAAAVDFPPGLVVLVAEDNPVNLLTIKAFLEGRGAVVLAADNGRKALLLAQTKAPDLILMDIQMSQMDGLQATEAIRKLPDARARSVPVVAVTALAMPGDRERCLAAGATAYMTKPLLLLDLARLVGRLTREAGRGPV